MTLRASNCERRGAGMTWKPSPQAEGHGTRQRHLLRRPRLRDAALAAPVVDARPERGGACLAAGQTREIEGALRLRFRCGRRRGGEVGQARVRGGARRTPERRHARCQSAQGGLQRRGRRLLALRFRFRRRRSGEVRQARVRFGVLRPPERRHGRHSRGRRRAARWRHGHVVISGQVNCCCFLLLHYRESRPQRCWSPREIVWLRCVSRAVGYLRCARRPSTSVASSPTARSPAQQLKEFGCLFGGCVAAHRTSDAGHRVPLTARDRGQPGAKIELYAAVLSFTLAGARHCWESKRQQSECQRYTRSSTSAVVARCKTLASRTLLRDRNATPPAIAAQNKCS